jgi:putative ABC transport system ATP-binding protein
MSGAQTILRLKTVEKSFREPAGMLRVLDGLNLAVSAGEIVLLQGPSGSGKTTLLQIIGCLSRADAGEIELAGEELNTASDAERTAMRQKHLGFAFQHFHLLDALTARENVALGLHFKRQPQNGGRVEEVLERLGITNKADKLPRDLSGGEKQRVALARAMVGKPSLLLADEPTSQLDSHSDEAVADLVRKLVREFDCAALIATHDSRLHSVADRICNLKEGKIHE